MSELHSAQQFPNGTIDDFYLRAGAGAVRQARDRIVAAARMRALPLSTEALADVRLCASEVITNALAHGGDECWVSITWTGGRLGVCVSDRSVQLPAVLPASTTSNSGRGLALVNALAHSWGWGRTQWGKTVYFSVAADTTPVADQRSAPVTEQQSGQRLLTA
ncbi:ATP-binding protein [Kitasatospora sp. RB6PN24]|uniref:ATP-binding protein n=1 Tax=Kitasatospora humi TaxID=2893891 RepID=UPI001E4D1D4D|nr:ATP-binding protein [Kitasatospora humi]MCC9311145.1 ATP-binding protein [Kitasatospora humi]